MEQQKKPRRRVKKVKAHGGHHGGAWKVAYADFVTAMMALFLVLWLVSQADVKLKQAIANYFRTPGVFDTLRGGVLSGQSKVSKQPEDLTFQEEEQTMFSIAEALRKQFESRKDIDEIKDRVKIEVTEEGLRIQLLDKADKISFNSGRAELNEEAKGILSEIAQAICDMPNPILIGGHTDRHVLDNPDYTNWELSTDRANAARRTLEAQCVKPEQIRKIVGYADTEPLVPEDPYSPANRRISITVLRTNNDAEDKKSNDDEPVKSKPTSSTNANQKVTKEITLTSSAANKSGEPEARTGKAKLTSEGEVKVGEPDKIPAGVKTTKQP